LLKNLQPSIGLVPDLTDDLFGLRFEDILDGVRPDIIGELYVLDRLAVGEVERVIARQLLGLAWHTNAEAYAAFVERVAGDHPEHERLVDLLDVDDWQDSPAAAARLAADTIPPLRRSNHPALEWIFARLAALLEASGQTAIKEVMVIARFRFANLVLGEGDYRKANELYSDALSDSDPSWSVRGAILVNRGITWLHLGNKEAAKSDWTAVVESDVATYEARACALNNRADIYDEENDPESAVADRTAVLALPDTTYDRRFIAHARRARARWKLKQDVAANDDIESILTSPDIAVEQKMNARLLRAKWLINTGRSIDATPDLEAIIASKRNFDGIEASARGLLDDLKASADDESAEVSNRRDAGRINGISANGNGVG
jgi:predicted negative regulator of RcsB-dependent stress response